MIQGNEKKNSAFLKGKMKQIPRHLQSIKDENFMNQYSFEVI